MKQYIVMVGDLNFHKKKTDKYPVLIHSQPNQKK